MTKRKIIDDIIVSNPSASPEFLAQFDQTDLLAYLRHLEVVKIPALTGDANRYARYFPAPLTDHIDELSVWSPSPRATSARCPAAVASPVDADLLDRTQFDAELLDLVGDMASPAPGDPRADTIEFEPIIVADPARPAAPADSPADEPQPAEQTTAAADRITRKPEQDLVAAHARPNHGFDDEQESWLF